MVRMTGMAGFRRCMILPRMLGAHRRPDGQAEYQRTERSLKP
jgi:hypothetical protein